MQPIVEVSNLTKRYQVYRKKEGLLGSVQSFFSRQNHEVAAVNNISFNLEPGEVVGFLGGNGAGKTTTLKMLSGILRPTDGKVTVLGFDPFERRREFLKSISLVLGQKQQLAWDLAPVDSFLLNRVIYDIPESDYRQRVGELTELMALEDVIHRPVRKLSLGERMKCELALALLHRPKLLFLDEPTIGLDVNMQQAVRSYIADYNQRYQATILLTSHYMSDVEALAHRVIVVDQAEIVFDGDLRGLVTVNEPRKVLRLWLSSPVKQEILRGYAKVSRYEGLEVNFLVERNDVPRVVSKLLAELPVADISIEEEPIERIIGSLLSGRASNR